MLQVWKILFVTRQVTWQGDCALQAIKKCNIEKFPLVFCVGSVWIVSPPVYCESVWKWELQNCLLEVERASSMFLFLCGSTMNGRHLLPWPVECW